MAVTAAGSRLTEAHRLAQTRLGAQTTALLFRLWPLLDPTRVDATAATWSTAVLAVLQAQRTRSAGLAATYYKGFRAVEVGGNRTVPTLADALPLAAVRTSLAVTGPAALKTGTKTGTLAKAVETARTLTAASGLRHVLNGGRQTLLNAVQADTDAHGWARVTSGSPCHFCAMLSGRGPVYRRQDTADFLPHDGCGCSVEVVYGDTDAYAWPGRGAEFADLYAEATAGHSGRDALNAFRRLYEERHGIAPSRAPAAPPAPAAVPAVVPAPLAAEESFVTNLLGRLRGGQLTRDQLAELAARDGVSELGRLNARTALARYDAELAEQTARRAAEAALTDDQYALLRPAGSWSQGRRDAIVASLDQTEGGRRFREALDLFQKGGPNIARLRGAIEQRAAGADVAPPWGERADAWINAVRHAPTDQPPVTLYRGMTVKGTAEQLLAKWTKGSDLDWSMSSFTSDRKVATRFQRWTADRAGKRATKVMVELVGAGKKAVPIQNATAADRAAYWGEKEWVSMGRYRIVEVKRSPSGGLILRVEQKGVL